MLPFKLLFSLNSGIWTRYNFEDLTQLALEKLERKKTEICFFSNKRFLLTHKTEIGSCDKSQY